MRDNGEAVVLFDGMCSLCSAVVIFLLKRDRKGKLLFASLQSKAGQKLLRDYDVPSEKTNKADTFVYIEKGRYYLKSTAALKVIRRLDRGWPLLYPLVIIPRPVRDHCYGFIARNRYKWFGARQHCMLPKPEWTSRFLPEAENDKSRSVRNET